jgi:NAD(P)-dependent dehydrogenase (short-subunit alcohol dehydrogenase family)
MRLLDKTAIVTGAGTGIGAGIAVELARQGADVLINYAHSQEGAQEVARQVEACGRRAIVCRADVSRSDDIEAMVERAWKAFGRIDILVNNTGITRFVDFFELTEADWDQILDTNLKGMFICSQAVARHMRQTGGGVIINLGSVHGRTTVPDLVPYAASKGGIEGLTRAMALGLAPYNIRVNAVAPGLIEVDRVRRDPLYDRQMRANQIPLGRVGQPEDIARVVVFFASEDSCYVTGQVLYADGGMTSKLSIRRTKD